MKVNFTLFYLLLSTGLSFAHNGHQCADRKQHAGSMAKTTIATPEEDHYDITHLKFNISLTNTGTAVSGDVITTARVAVASMPVYAFELDPQITVDSFKLNGQLMTVASAGSVRTVNLTTPLTNNAVFTAQVFYHGQPTNGTGFFTRGLNHVALGSGTHIMYTLSDMYTADDWWPSKQSLVDKIDSVDMWVTVPAGIKAGSNGLLKNVTAMPGGSSRYEWKTNYPIVYYLISVAVAPYGDYSYYMHFSNSNDSMLVQNYVYDSLAYMTPARKAALDTTGLIVDHFSDLFGRYPFWKEKYGHCIAEPLGGGMEHQTMTTLAYAETNLIAHELGHQWWGDHVTYTSWRDIWLSEGFATYCEQLFREHFWGTAAAKILRTQTFNNVTAANDGSVYVDDTTSANRVFNSRLTYRKGAAVAHMLRYVAPDDATYFQLLRDFQQSYANGLAVTEDLKNMAATLYNRNLDTFFNQWVYNEGHPTYSMKWYQAGDDVYLQVNQVASKPSSVSVFAMPLEIKLQSAAGDTTIKVYNDQASQNYSLKWGKTMTGLAIDPDDHVVNKQGFITKDPLLNIGSPGITTSVNIYPNPAKEEWIIEHAPKGEYALYDLSGKKLWQSKGNGKLKVPATQLAPGNYTLVIAARGMENKTFHLVKY